jgi:hypothetical protein
VQADEQVLSEVVLVEDKALREVALAEDEALREVALVNLANLANFGYQNGLAGGTGHGYGTGYVAPSD